MTGADMTMLAEIIRDEPRGPDRDALKSLLYAYAFGVKKFMATETAARAELLIHQRIFARLGYPPDMKACYDAHKMTVRENMSISMCKGSESCSLCEQAKAVIQSPPPGMNRSSWLRMLDSRSWANAEQATELMSAKDVATSSKKLLDSAFRFIAGLNLQDQPLSVQREQRELVSKVSLFLKPPKIREDT